MCKLFGFSAVCHIIGFIAHAVLVPDFCFTYAMFPDEFLGLALEPSIWDLKRLVDAKEELAIPDVVPLARSILNGLENMNGSLQVIRLF